MRWHAAKLVHLRDRRCYRGAARARVRCGVPRRVDADKRPQRILEEDRPAALALSCSLTANLVEAARSIDVAHRHGIPVIVGGAAFGDTEERATALGADAWSGAAEGAAAILDRWALAPPRTFGASLALGGDHIDIAEQRATLIERAMHSRSPHRPPAPTTPAGSHGCEPRCRRSSTTLRAA